MTEHGCSGAKRLQRLLTLALLFTLAIASWRGTGSAIRAANAVGTSGSAASAQLAYGQVAPGEIGAPGEADAYSFQATAGDVILVAASRVAGDLWVRVRLCDPNG